MSNLLKRETFRWRVRDAVLWALSLAALCVLAAPTAGLAVTGKIVLPFQGGTVPAHFAHLENNALYGNYITTDEMHFGNVVLDGPAPAGGVTLLVRLAARTPGTGDFGPAGREDPNPGGEDISRGGIPHFPDTVETPALPPRHFIEFLPGDGVAIHPNDRDSAPSFVLLHILSGERSATFKFRVRSRHYVVTTGAHPSGDMHFLEASVCGDMSCNNVLPPFPRVEFWVRPPAGVAYIAGGYGNDENIFPWVALFFKNNHFEVRQMSWGELERAFGFEDNDAVFFGSVKHIADDTAEELTQAIQGWLTGASPRRHHVAFAQRLALLGFSTGGYMMSRTLSGNEGLITRPINFVGLVDPMRPSIDTARRTEIAAFGDSVIESLRDAVTNGVWVDNLYILYHHIDQDVEGKSDRRPDDWEKGFLEFNAMVRNDALIWPFYSEPNNSDGKPNFLGNFGYGSTFFGLSSVQESPDNVHGDFLQFVASDPYHAHAREGINCRDLSGARVCQESLRSDLKPFDASTGHPYEESRWTIPYFYTYGADVFGFGRGGRGYRNFPPTLTVPGGPFSVEAGQPFTIEFTAGDGLLEFGTVKDVRILGDQGFPLAGTFTGFTSLDSINSLLDNIRTEGVTLEVGTFSITIPGNVAQENFPIKCSSSSCSFNNVINDVTLTVKIGWSFILGRLLLDAQAHVVDLSGTVRPVVVKVRVGTEVFDIAVFSETKVPIGPLPGMAFGVHVKPSSVNAPDPRLMPGAPAAPAVREQPGDAGMDPRTKHAPRLRVPDHDLGLAWPFPSLSLWFHGWHGVPGDPVHFPWPHPLVGLEGGPVH